MIHHKHKIVLSASRRTDIPAFYMDWFMHGIREGCFEVVNPFSRQVSRVDCTVENVHTIVFWSKNFQPFLENGYGERLRKAGYHLFFNFTVNSPSTRLEPGVPDLSRRIQQLECLCRRFDPGTVTWRFDPIIFNTDSSGTAGNNLGSFVEIADAAAGAGITRCVTSFLDIYAKVKRRVAGVPDLTLVDPSDEEKCRLLLQMEKTLSDRKISLSTCCEASLMKKMPRSSTISASSCIPSHLLAELFGGHISLQPDRGQRVKQGCGCGLSVDIGSYSKHPCYHDCLFCYANPVSPKRREED